MEHIAKNEIVHPRSRYPTPQPCVPCHRLPFSVHQYICDELDSDEEWTRLAEVALDDCCKEDIEGRLNTCRVYSSPESYDACARRVVEEE